MWSVLELRFYKNTHKTFYQQNNDHAVLQRITSTPQCVTRKMCSHIDMKTHASYSPTHRCGQKLVTFMEKKTKRGQRSFVA